MAVDHTYVICAYGESQYLEACILSLKAQNRVSQILIVTSTPNERINKLAEKYQIPYYINQGEKGITQDWNFALSKVKTRYATIAHQDDVYEVEYTKLILDKMAQSKKPLIAFTDYSELRNNKKIYNTYMLKIKRFMLFPMRIRVFSKNKFVRRRVLALGDPICCPSVTFCLENLIQPIFRNEFRSCEDWEAWERISRMDGDFLYLPIPLMSHRIHSESETSKIIADNARVKENYRMYCKFWPKYVAKCINFLYTLSEQSNRLD